MLLTELPNDLTPLTEGLAALPPYRLADRRGSGFDLALFSRWPFGEWSVDRSAGWHLPEDEWLEMMELLESQHLVCRASGATWVLCRDLGGYSLHQLLVHLTWPLPRPGQLPEQLDEAWYPPLRKALELLQEEQQALFGGSLAQWLKPGND